MPSQYVILFVIFRYIHTSFNGTNKLCHLRTINWSSSNDGLRSPIGNIPSFRSTYPWCDLMKKNSSLQAYLGEPLEKQKVQAEQINGRLALVGVFALVGAYLSTGQIIPGYL